MNNGKFSSEFDLSLEQKIIGGLLSDSEAINRVNGLEAGHFSLERHQLIFNAIERVIASGSVIDLMTVCSSLQDEGELEKVGGQHYLAGLLFNIVSAYNIDHQAKLLISTARKNKLAVVASEISQVCNDKTISSDELIEVLKQKVASLQGSDKSALIVAVEEVRKILLDEKINESEKEIKIEKIKDIYKVSNHLWEKLIKPIRIETERVRLNLELKALLQSEDKLEQHLNLASLAQKFRVSVSTLEKALSLMKNKTQTVRYEVDDLDFILNSPSQAIDYLVPGLLPKGESTLLVASPKVGKSLLGVDLAFAVATGESEFLGEKCKTGKVLYVSVDESKQSAGRKLAKRGFRACDKDKIKIVTRFVIDQLNELEKTIEDFRPSLVIIDSLKRITMGLDISENDAQFSENVYTLSELCNRYGASCVLIHHTKKDTEITGVESVRGSSAIAGAVANTWILSRIEKTNPNNKSKKLFDPRDAKRKFMCFSRDSEGKFLEIELNPENNSWAVIGEEGLNPQEQAQQQTAKERILTLLRINQQQNLEGVSGSFLHECLELQSPGAISKGYLYVVLNRLVDEKIINSRPAPGNKRYTLYSLPVTESNQSSVRSPEHKAVSLESKPVIDNKNLIPPSPPPLTDTDDIYESETYTEYELEHTYHDIYHTPINHLSSQSENRIDSSDKPDEITVLGIPIIEGDTIGGVGSNPNLIENEESSNDLTRTPVVGETYLDPQSCPHQIVRKDNDGWFDQNGDIVTPGIFNDGKYGRYRVWKESDITFFMNEVLSALIDFENGSLTLMTVLSLDESNYEKIKFLGSRLETYLGVDRWELLNQWFNACQSGSIEL